MRSSVFSYFFALALIFAFLPVTADARQKAVDFKGLYRTKFVAGSAPEGLSRTYRFDDIEISGKGRLRGRGTVVEKGRRAKVPFPAPLSMSGRLGRVVKLTNRAGTVIGLYSNYRIRLTDGTTISGTAKIFFGANSNPDTTSAVDAKGVAETPKTGSTNVTFKRTFPPAG